MGVGEGVVMDGGMDVVSGLVGEWNSDSDLDSGMDMDSGGEELAAARIIWYGTE